jgi:thiamine biosynthesis lipoprotein
MMQEYPFRAMGCHMLAVIDRDDAPAIAQLAEVPGWFEAWEQQLSRFRADSDLSRLNATSGRPVMVPPALWEVLGVALDAARQSEGLVQPTILAALEAAGYDRSFVKLAPAMVGAPSPARAGDWRALKLDRQTHAVTLPTDVRLDLGGVAKGWAADQAARRLAQAGPALVDAGGDISVSGPMADGLPWPIAIANPFAPAESLGLVLLARGAVATSGRDYRRWTRGGLEQHHIIDPRSGQPAQTDILSTTIVAPDGPLAEIAAKVTLILGSRAGLAWLDARPMLAGLLVLEDGRILPSRRMEAYLDTISLPVHGTSALEVARPLETIQ